MNPLHRAWLPILHTRREKRRYTALFSNTPRAHELGRTHDWVVLYWEQDGERGQHTVVTATLGPLRSRRVVRGREGECAEYYRAQGALVL
jgi:putative hydrolase